MTAKNLINENVSQSLSTTMFSLILWLTNSTWSSGILLNYYLWWHCAMLQMIASIPQTLLHHRDQYSCWQSYVKKVKSWVSDRSCKGDDLVRHLGFSSLWFTIFFVGNFTAAALSEAAGEGKSTAKPQQDVETVKVTEIPSSTQATKVNSKLSDDVTKSPKPPSVVKNEYLPMKDGAYEHTWVKLSFLLILKC